MKLPGPEPKTEILLRVIAASLLLPQDRTEICRTNTIRRKGPRRGVRQTNRMYSRRFSRYRTVIASTVRAAYDNSAAQCIEYSDCTRLKYYRELELFGFRQWTS